MKNKGVILSIVGILILGIIVTVNTRRLVATEGSQESLDKNFRSASANITGFGTSAFQNTGLSEEKAAESKAEEAAELEEALPYLAPLAQDGGEGEEARAETEEATAGAAAGTGLLSSPPKEASAEEPPARTEAGERESPQELALEDSPVSSVGGQSEVVVEISPLTGARATVREEDSSGDLLEEYTKKLEELEVRIQRLRASDLSFNTDSYKSMADYEYRLWDTELNAVYQDLLRRMDEDEAKALKKEEKEWMSERDTNAHKASEKYKGGTLESMEYTASLAKDTRDRTYELLDQYGSCLSQEENESGKSD